MTISGNMGNVPMLLYKNNNNYWFPPIAMTVEAAAPGIVCTVVTGDPITRTTGQIYVPIIGLTRLSYPDAIIIVCNNTTAGPIAISVSEVMVDYGPSAPLPSPTPSPSPTPTPTSFGLKVTFFTDNEPDPITNGSSSVATIKPSVYGCSRYITRKLRSRSFKVECVDLSTSDSVSGCSLSVDLVLGTDHGGHEHDFNSRPLGSVFSPDIVLGEGVMIPTAGLKLSYESPEVGGDVDLVLSARRENKNVAPAFIRFEVRQTVEKYISLSSPGLDFIVNSHSDGDKGSARFRKKLDRLLDRYTMHVFRLLGTVVTIPRLKSEAGSLSNGGLFDINYPDGYPWVAPHCGHRDGETADISYSVFASYPASTRDLFVEALEAAFDDIGVNAIFEVYENGNKHWHVHSR